MQQSFTFVGKRVRGEAGSASQHSHSWEPGAWAVIMMASGVADRKVGEVTGRKPGATMIMAHTRGIGLQEGLRGRMANELLACREGNCSVQG